MAFYTCTLNTSPVPKNLSLFKTRNGGIGSLNNYTIHNLTVHMRQSQAKSGSGYARNPSAPVKLQRSTWYISVEEKYWVAIEINVWADLRGKSCRFAWGVA